MRKVESSNIEKFESLEFARMVSNFAAGHRVREIDSSKVSVCETCGVRRFDSLKVLTAWELGAREVESPTVWKFQKLKGFAASSKAREFATGMTDNERFKD